MASRSATLDELLALNDEIAALIRAGVPLEIGLRGFSESVTGRVAALSGQLADRLNAGESLSEALNAETSGLPAVYRAVIEAGQRTGRLPDALGSVARHARTLQDVRRQVSLALIYPGLLLITAYYLFWAFVGRLIPLMIATTGDHGGKISSGMAVVQTIADAVDSAGHIPPAILGLLLLWWLFAGRIISPGSGLIGIGLRWVPGMGKTLQQFRLATFCELSAVLLEQEVPLPRSLRLAAAAGGDSRLIDDAENIAGAIERGESPAVGIQAARRFPPFMRWSLDRAAKQAAWLASLRQLAETYQRRAESRAGWFKLLFPTIVVLVVGGTAVALYCVSVVYPLSQMMQELGAER